MRKLIVALVALMMCWASGAGEKLSVLAIGNSFTQSLLPELPKVAQAAGCKLDLAIFALGGRAFSNHWANCEVALTNRNFRPYIVRGKRTNLPEILSAQTWDVITLQQAGNGGMWAWTFDPDADRLVAFIRARQPKAKLYFQLTWSYNVASPFLFGGPGKLGSLGIDQAEMYKRLKSNYTLQARRLGLNLIPVGTAIQDYRSRLPVTFVPPSKQELKTLAAAGRLPDLKGALVGSYRFTGKGNARQLRFDDIHLNREGKYLQACVWTATLFGVDIRNLPYVPDFGADFQRRAPLIRACAQAAVSNGELKVENVK